MAFTPTNLSIASLGSVQLTIARINGSITSGTNNWNSGIQDVQAVFGQYRDAISWATQSDTSIAISFTGSNGTIWTQIPVAQSGTSFDLLVISGFATDMTW